MQRVAPMLACLLGSPRRGGNTDLLAAEVCRGFESAGGVTEQIALSRFHLLSCTGCNACREDRPEPCILDDDMQMLYQKMLASSALLWASPVYSWAPTVEMKIVLDRQFAWGDYQTTRHAAALAGRPVGAVMCYADPDPATNGFYHAYSILKVVAEASGGRFAGCVHGPGFLKGDILEHPAVLEQAYELGAKLFRMSHAASS
jgi:NAD(P)H-dependent FMN reductase